MSIKTQNQHRLRRLNKKVQSGILTEQYAKALYETREAALKSRRSANAERKLKYLDILDETKNLREQMHKNRIKNKLAKARKAEELARKKSRTRS